MGKIVLSFIVGILIGIGLVIVCGTTGPNKFIVEQISINNGTALYRVQAENIVQFKIKDIIGKFQVGDTLRLTK